MFFGQMDWEDQSGPPPNHFTTYIIEPSLDELQTELSLFAQELLDNGFVNAVGKALGTKYFLMDKTNLAELVGLNAPQFAQFDFPYVQTGDSPRKTGWKDADGVKREPPPSEGGPGKGAAQDLSGSQDLVNTFIDMMNTLIKVYTSQGDKRTVGILKNLLERFLSGLESITDILDELRKLFII